MKRRLACTLYIQDIMLDLWRWQYLLLPEYSRILLYTVTETFNIPTYTVTIMHAIHLTGKPFTPLPIYHYTINQKKCINYMSNTTGVTQEARTAYPLRAPGFIPGCWWDPCCSSLSIPVLCFCCICLRPVSCVPKCCQCLWVVHCWLPLRFSLTLI